MSIKGTGSGRAGKLRMRTKDKRWIEIPYGAGQDTNIRSVNIWNGSEWVCPTWGRLLWPWIYTDLGLTANLDSLLFRKPDGFTWTGWDDSTNAPNAHVNNPNYRTHDTSAQQWTVPFNANWERLFYVQPRTDPTYRIVPLRYPLPLEPPNVTLDLEADFYTKFRSFWPAIITNTVWLDDGQINPNFGTWDALDMAYYEYFDLQSQIALSSYLHTDGPATDNPLHSYQHDRRIYQVGNIDLKMIRQRLAAIYPQQDVDFTGQKNDIKHQQLNRVMVKLLLQPTITYWAKTGQADPGGKDFDAVQFSLRFDGNIDTHTEVAYGGGTGDNYAVTVNVPTSTDPGGVPIWTDTAQGLAHSVLVPSFAFGADYYTKFQVGSLETAQQIQIEHDFEAPGENSLCFYAEIINPVVWQPYFSEVFINLQVFAQFISLQYADPGKDVPDELKRADAVP